MPAKSDAFKDADYKIFYEEFKSLNEGCLALYAVGCHTPFKLIQLLNSSVSNFAEMDENGFLMIKKSVCLLNTCVCLPEQVQDIIMQYLHERLDERRSRGMKDYTFMYEPMFLSNSGQLITESGFSKMLYRIKKRNAIEEAYSVQSMRKTYFKKIYQRDGIVVAARLMKRSVKQAAAYLGVKKK